MNEIGEAARSIDMTLAQLIARIGALANARVIGGDLDLGAVEVRAIRADSRAVEPGDVFVAMRGLRSDGHAFVAAAIERGAAAIVVEHEVTGVDARVPQVIVTSGASAFGALVSRVAGDPAAAMTMIGVTGTNGKTTTTYLVEAILAAAGAHPGVIGTVSYRWAGKEAEAPYTTPTPEVLHEALATMRADGTDHVVMEVSSAALAMNRVAGVQFAVAAFSNLTQDHLDVHGSMAAYRDAKKRLFSEHLAATGIAVVNIDDPVGAEMAAAAPGRVLRVSADGRNAEISVVWNETTVRGIRARVATPRGELDVSAPPLIGHYNVANLALAIGIAEALGIDHAAIARGIASLPGVPGRVERVRNDADLDVLVDYAHTPDALRNVLAAVRPLTARRLICVFGCGGDRDPGKRPKMGAAVAELADLAVVTSDNPRTESPRAIIDQILPAVPNPFVVEVDRRVAIRAAIAEATPGDIVVIAGKGHEDYQILGTTKIHFDDREEAAAAIAARWHRTIAELAADAGTKSVADDTISRVIIDGRLAAPGDLYVAIRGEVHDGHAFAADAIRAGARAVMVDHTIDVAAPQLVVGDTRIALGLIAQAHRKRWSDAPSDGSGSTRRLVAITGSAGKTTTKELTRAALAEAGPTHAAVGSLNNETGVPLTLIGMRPFHRFAVVEMGMRGLGQIEYLTRIAEPDVAVVVNAGTAHLELLGSPEAIVRAKAEIWLGLRAGGTVVRPVDDDRLAGAAIAHQPRARTVTFGERDGADVQLLKYTPSPAGAELELFVFGARHPLELGLVGRHAAIDACCALAAAHAAGASVEQALVGLGRARPAAMRGEIVTVAGRHVIVDCYNANPASMAAALATLAERAAGRTAIAVVGDMLELGPTAPARHREVGAAAAKLGLGVIALPEHGASVVAAAGAGAELVHTPTEAAARALARTQAGDWILLKASRGVRLERVLDELRAQTASGTERT